MTKTFILPALLLCIFFMAYVNAKKTKITLYNDSLQSIIVSIDTEPHLPLTKNTIQRGEAKNFFVQLLTPQTPFYIVIEASQDDPKTFVMHLDNKKRTLTLERNGYTLNTTQDSFADMAGHIELLYKGSLVPYLPEIDFLIT